MPRPIAVFSDFDGTITLRDSNDALVDRYIGATRREAYDRLFAEGHGTLWEVLDTSMQACEVPLERAVAFLLESVELDPGFVAFQAFCEREGLPLAILSAGLLEVIEAFMARAGLTLPITANQAHHPPGCFGLTPVDASCPTGVDKAMVLQASKDAGNYTVFVGDGFSDRLAAPVADLVYAKTGKALAVYCERKGIPFVAFERFDEVLADLAKRLPDLV